MNKYLILFNLMSLNKIISDTEIKVSKHDFTSKVVIEAMSTEEAMDCFRKYIGVGFESIIEIKQLNITL